MVCGANGHYLNMEYVTRTVKSIWYIKDFVIRQHHHQRNSHVQGTVPWKRPNLALVTIVVGLVCSL